MHEKGDTAIYGISLSTTITSRAIFKEIIKYSFLSLHNMSNIGEIKPR